MCGRPHQLVGPSVRLLRLSSDRQVIQRGAVVVTEHDVLVGYRLRLFTLAEERGNVSEACRLRGAPLDLLPLEAPGRPVGA